MSGTLAEFSTNIARFTGFAELYDRCRPSPPEQLGALLARYVGDTVPQRVIDVGCGTGLSTRYWSERANEVIGIDPSPDMLAVARSSTHATNVEYRVGLSHDTGLEAGSATLVSCSQSLHWMDPESTFREVRRILRPGGVFAANDYEWPPSAGAWEAEEAYRRCMARGRQFEEQLGLTNGLRQWSKSGHLERMRASGCFRFTAEILLHHTDHGNAERFVGVLLTQGYVAGVMKRGITEKDLLLDELRATAQRTIGPRPRPWFWSARVQIGVV